MEDQVSLYSSRKGHAAMMSWYAAGLTRMDVACESLTVPTRFGETHLLAAGPADAPPVILLHGMEGNAVSWRYQLKELASSFRLYALDIIGSAGRSAPRRLSHTGLEYAEWLYDVLVELNIDQAAFVGISNGSWLVVKLAGLAPERIDRALLLSANGLVPVRFPFRLARALDYAAVHAVKDALAALLLTRGMVRVAVTRNAPPGAVMDPDEIEWFYLLAKHYRFRFPPPPLHDIELRALTAPTLLLMGEHETFFEAEAAIARARRLLPHLVQAELVPGAGHNMAIERPDYVNARIRAFLEAPLATVRDAPSLSAGEGARG
jgi:pimeloyl-ACP methyl ester carboxylesterase